MINANELRIGNFILSDGLPVKVECVLDYYINIRTKQGNLITCQLELAQPIQLGPELLLKNGFTTDEGKVEYRIGLPIGHGEDLFIEDEGHPSMSCGIKTSDKQFNYFKDLRYLHQLQNLYFALTGTELTINL